MTTSKCMDDLNQVERIKIKLRLAKNTDSFLEVFGANRHKYRLDSPADISEVEAFEQKYNISLPEGYKVFVTQVGNGGYQSQSQVGNSGAGPSYGIYKLGYKNHYIADIELGYLAKEPFFTTKTTKEDWAKISDNISEDITDDEYEKEFARVYSGILTIGASGCAGFMGIMLSGENVGRVIHIYDELEYCPAFAEESNFLDWYENWLDSIISGQRIGIYTKEHKTEEECFTRYTTTEYRFKDNIQHWKLVALKYIRGLASICPENRKILWENFASETDEKIRLYILNLLAKFDYANATEELKKLSETSPLEFLRILHLFAGEKTSDWQDTIKKLFDESPNPEVSEYIKYVAMSDAC